MTSRRRLKKEVNYLFGELFTEAMVHYLYVPGTDKAKADEVMSRILNEQADFVARISHTEPGNVKGYYRNYIENFNQVFSEIAEEINHLKV